MIKLFFAWQKGVAPFWQYINIDGILISIELCNERPSDYNGYLLADSGGFTFRKFYLNEIEHKAKNPIKVLLNQMEKLTPKACITLDIPPDPKFDKEENQARLETTIENANIIHDYVLKKGIIIPEICYAIQGWDKESYEYCANQIKDLGNYFSIPTRLILGYQLSSDVGKIGDLSNGLKRIKEILGKDKRIHVLALGSLKIIKSLKDLVWSCDVQIANMSAYGELLNPFNGESRITQVDGQRHPLSLTSGNKIRMLRELYNAFILNYHKEMLDKTKIIVDNWKIETVKKENWSKFTG